MRNILVSILISFCVCSCSKPLESERKGIIPTPLTQEGLDEPPFTLSSGTVISYSDSSLIGIARLLADDIKKQLGLSLKVELSAKTKNRISLNICADNSVFTSLPSTYGISAKDEELNNERYLLNIASEGIQITGSSPEGVYRGTTSLRHLLGISNGNKKINIPTVRIKDTPVFAWRGLSLDVSRTFFEVEEVKQVIDMLALYKMNVLHLHLTDNQGWRLEIKKHPQINEIGSFVENQGRKGGYYTHEQYKDIVNYAAERFITIVPELDLPGHTTPVFASFPEFNNCANLEYAMYVPGQAVVALDPDDEKAMQFVRDVLDELIEITPGPFIHIGGDETFGMREDKFISFVNKIRPMVLERGKKIIGWQEISRADIGEGDLYQNWIYFKKKGEPKKQSDQASSLPKELVEMFAATYAKGAQDIPCGIGKGAKLILSPREYAYMDHPYTEQSVDSLQENERKRLGLNLGSYAGCTIEEIYNWNPTTLYPDIDWKQDLAGVEAGIWCETIESFSDLQFLLLPRLTGMAEKAWSHNNNDWENYRSNLSYQAPLWENENWNFFKSSLVDWK